MANSNGGDGIPVERAEFYSHDEVANEQNGKAVIEHAVAQLPGLPFFAPVLGRSDERYRRTIRTILQRFSNEVHRPLTPQEAEHMARHQHRRLAINAWGDVAYLTTGFLLWRRGAATAYPNPIGKPNPSFNNQVFGEGFLPRSMQVRGPSAFRLWSSVRLIACVGLAYVVVGRTIFPTYGTVRVTMDMLEDPALKPYIEERSKLAGAQGKRPSPVGNRGFVPPPSVPSPAPTPEIPPVDYTNQALPEQQQGWGNDTALDEQQEKPTASAAQRGPALGSQTSGSAWERLRRSAGAGGNTASQGDQAARPQSWADRRRAAEQASADQGSDSYSYTQSDEDRALARQLAQKEFDAMLERERQGSDEHSRRRL